MEGGGLVTLLSGMLIGIMNAIGTGLILTLIPKVGFHSRIRQIQVSVISIVLLLYTNICLITLADRTHLSYRWF